MPVYPLYDLNKCLIIWNMPSNYDNKVFQIQQSYGKPQKIKPEIRSRGKLVYYEKPIEKKIREVTRGKVIGRCV